MAKAKPKILASLLILLNFFFAACAIQESRSQVALPYRERISDIFSPTQKESLFQGGINKEVLMKKIRRMMIGSTAPTCTYNECRGCRYKCRAEQVPVEGNDPINSAYHYRCVCHR
ncbi:uncharacterized protein LOC21398921 [Morus notabilis]|uniref:uncharacterized protein LOC21398921 n=1 Tax=Morus notabilis TaxID=981085 RepID=UPI000CED0469|nr:uncharacterized protein LOC21398921 [Morus notabilis]